MSVILVIVVVTCAALVAAPAMMYTRELMSDKDIKEAEKEFEKLLAA